MFSRSRNPLSTFLLSCHGCVALANPSQLPVHEVLESTDDYVSWILTISSVFMFLRSNNPLPTFILSCNAWVTSKIEVNFRYRRYSKVLMIVSHGFSQFLQYLCFRCPEIHCRHSYKAAMLEWPQKSDSTSGTGGSLLEGTDDFVLWIFTVNFSSIMFLRSRNPLLTFLLSYLAWVTSKTSRTESFSEISRSPNMTAQSKCQQMIPRPWKH